MISKVREIENVIGLIHSGNRVMVGGFGVPGTPFTLLDALLELGADELTLIKNEANEDHMGASKLLEAGRVNKLITTHLGLNKTAIGLMNQRKIEVEFYPQGILAEKIRSGGAGLFGFLTDIGMDTDLLYNTKRRTRLGGRELIIEPAITADVALLHAHTSDGIGNLVYAKSAMNFNPIMATAANLVIVEVEKAVEIGTLEPEHVHTPGAFVDYIIELDELSDDYGILAHHVK